MDKGLCSSNASLTPWSPMGLATPSLLAFFSVLSLPSIQHRSQELVFSYTAAHASGSSLMSWPTVLVPAKYFPIDGSQSKRNSGPAPEIGVPYKGNGSVAPGQSASRTLGCILPGLRAVRVACTAVAFAPPGFLPRLLSSVGDWLPFSRVLSSPARWLHMLSRDLSLGRRCQDLTSFKVTSAIVLTSWTALSG